MWEWARARARESEREPARSGGVGAGWLASNWRSNVTSELSRAAWWSSTANTFRPGTSRLELSTASCQARSASPPIASEASVPNRIVLPGMLLRNTSAPLR